ncbi:serine protease [Saccharothrix violaceirubra]|uniref:Secreted trypsin-like serine protease n=1 Tax=Saccharothrix violaceirubra TaxID=413306 RepID=A0A7W7T021_9PSEU|nr:serine protease [Saccharothrix violaceirubra]MBB4964000.1 secreted trypsin-like serine protease [Saccharothrix violaceirubra]
MRTLLRALTASLLVLALVTPPATADPRIVGGQVVTDIAEAPWMVALVTTAGRHVCGGTLIAPALVATAAHCVATYRAEDLLVVGGRADLSKPVGIVSRTTQIVLNPAYKTAQIGADAALLYTTSTFPYPVLTVPSRSETYLYTPGTVGTVLGWGRTFENGPGSLQLRKALVPIVSDAECAAAYKEYVPKAHVCAGFPEGGVDACQGDSGGPLVVNGRLAGIVSWGTGCARPGKPGVYTRVTSYVSY